MLPELPISRFSEVEQNNSKRMEDQAGPAVWICVHAVFFGLNGILDRRYTRLIFLYTYKSIYIYNYVCIYVIRRTNLFFLVNPGLCQPATYLDDLGQWVLQVIQISLVCIVFRLCTPDFAFCRKGLALSSYQLVCNKPIYVRIRCKSPVILLRWAIWCHVIGNSWWVCGL